MPQNSGVNKVILLGTVLTQPRCNSYVDIKEEYAFTLVTSELIDRKEGPTEHLEYHNIILPDRFMPLNFELKKGITVYIEGKIQTINWIDDARVRRYKTEIVAQHMRCVNNTLQVQNTDERIVS